MTAKFSWASRLCLVMLACLVATGAGLFELCSVAARSQAAAPHSAHRILIHVASDDVAAMSHAISSADNAMKFYRDRGESVTIEIVANGGGVRMMRADTSPVAPSIAYLHQTYPSIVLSACGTTLRLMKEREGSEPSLLDGVRVTPAGIARIIELEEAGWSLSDRERDRGMTRRGLARLALAAVVACDASVAIGEEVFAERFVTFEPPVPLTPIVLLDRNNRDAVLVPRRGRTTLIALWASWCAACHRDIPRLAAAQQSLAKEGIDVTLVNVEGAPLASVLARSEDMSIGTVPLRFDPDGLRLAAPLPNGRRSPFQLFGMPILFVVDRNELVRGYVKGSVDWTSPDVRAFFRSLAGA